MKCLFCRKNKFEVFGPQGGISTKLSLPSGHKEGEKYNLVILMHGFIAKKSRKPITTITEYLTDNGYAVLSFDFDAHGKSEGKFIDMTMSSEIADARAVFEYACGLPFVKDIAFLGHSQGGVIAGMLAGQLAGEEKKPKCLIQLAPAAVLKDDAIAGRCMFSKYDAKNPPEYVSVLFHKLGRKFILEAQKLPIYETSAKYEGPVCLIHGTKDAIVPLSYSEKYNEVYKDSVINVLEGENHFLSKKSSEVKDIVLKFLAEKL